MNTLDGNWKKLWLVAALSGFVTYGVQAQSAKTPSGTTQIGSAHSVPTGSGPNAHHTTGVDERSGDMSNARNGEMVMSTISEEKTEIQQLAAQAAQFKKMGGRQNTRIANMLNRWIREHKAAAPTLQRLAAKHGADHNMAKILKQPVLGDKGKMLHATMMDHMKAVETSQMRYKLATDKSVKNAMRKRARLARKHMREMQPIHNAKNCPACASMMGNKMGSMGNMSGGAKMQKTAMTCPHCNVKMVSGKCPMCGMTASQMKSSGNRT